MGVYCIGWVECYFCVAALFEWVGDLLYCSCAQLALQGRMRLFGLAGQLVLGCMLRMSCLLCAVAALSVCTACVRPFL